MSWVSGDGISCKSDGGMPQGSGDGMPPINCDEMPL